MIKTQLNSETLTSRHTFIRALPTLWDESHLGQTLEPLEITCGDFELYEKLTFLKLSIWPQSHHNFVIKIPM